MNIHILFHSFAFIKEILFIITFQLENEINEFLYFHLLRLSTSSNLRNFFNSIK